MVDANADAIYKVVFKFSKHVPSDSITPTEEAIGCKSETETEQTADTTIELKEYRSDQEESDCENAEKYENERQNTTTVKPLLKQEASVWINVKPDDEEERNPALPLQNTGSLNSVKKQKCTCCSSFCRTCMKVLWFVWFLALVCLSIAQIIIGGIYLNDCTIQLKISRYLILSGSTSLISSLVGLATAIKDFCGGNYTGFRHFQLFLIFSLSIFFILGCVWVYGVHSTVQFNNPGTLLYCPKTLYYFSFWFLNGTFILIGLLIIIYTFYKCCKRTKCYCCGSDSDTIWNTVCGSISSFGSVFGSVFGSGSFGSGGSFSIS